MVISFAPDRDLAAERKLAGGQATWNPDVVPSLADKGEQPPISNVDYSAPLFRLTKKGSLR